MKKTAPKTTAMELGLLCPTPPPANELCIPAGTTILKLYDYLEGGMTEEEFNGYCFAEDATLKLEAIIKKVSDV